jgi:hypothetical protein
MKPPQPDAEKKLTRAERVRQAAGRGVSSKQLSDRAYWLDRDGERLRPGEEAWLDVLDELDRSLAQAGANQKKGGVKEPLCELLRSEVELTPRVRAWLADLVERYQFRRKPHGRPAPLYNNTRRQTTLDLAVEHGVRRLVAEGMNVDEACAAVAKGMAHRATTLRAALRGRDGATNRLRRRRRAP